MAFSVTSETLLAGGRAGPVYRLAGPDGSPSAEVWTGHGFNCLRWRAGDPARPDELLYAAPEWADDPAPTRSGVPVLFPFPNRIRDGRFHFGGRAYALPPNDPAGRNAIHGFAPRHPWRVLDAGAGPDAAWVTGVFQPSVDAPEVLGLWPGDYALAITCRLSRSELVFQARVENPGPGPLPFGLGFHPYLRPPGLAPGADVSRCRLQAAVAEEWELAASLPTGARSRTGAVRDLNAGVLLGGRGFDHLFHAAPPGKAAGGMRRLGALAGPGAAGALELWASGEFRELVVFTPPHRQAVALEPYTCATDALHLGAKGIDAGWQFLEPGRAWEARVELRLRRE